MQQWLAVQAKRSLSVAKSAPMQDEGVFAEFLRRIRSGDEQAAAEMVKQFEPLIRMEVRFRLNRPQAAPSL